MSRPSEVYREGRFFVTYLGGWWLLCEDTDDPENPDVREQYALRRSAVAAVQSLAKREREVQA